MFTIEEFLQGRGEGISGSGRVADQIHRLMLNAIVDGTLTSGQGLYDYVWADALGVSRTPVREAIQRLNALGLLDVAPARFTRLVCFAPDTAHQEARNWVDLHQCVVTSVVPTVTSGLLVQLHQARHQYQQQLTHGGRCVANFAFHQVLRDAVPNFALRLGATAAAYRFRLAEPHLPHHTGLTTALHTSIIAAIEGGLPDPAHKAMTRWAHALTDDIALAA